MVDLDKKDVPAQAGYIKNPEKRISPQEQVARFEQEAQQVPERREISQDDRMVSAELKKEIEMMELDDSAKGEANRKAKKIEFLGEKEKIEHLLQMAREKGIVFAIQVAKSMNAPYILDILHDTLAQEGFYLKMNKPTDDDNDKKKKT